MKKCRSLTACLMILAVFLLFNAYGKSKNLILETFNINSTSKEEVTDELVIAFFIEEIANEVTDFYSEYYSGEIAVYNYEVTIVDIGKKETGLISVKFGVTPQIGAHNPLGYDELLYHVDSRGNKSLAEYEHLENFEVPERFFKSILLTSLDKKEDGGFSGSYVKYNKYSVIYD